VIPYPTATSPDLVMRIVGPRLGETWSQPMVQRPFDPLRAFVQGALDAADPPDILCMLELMGKRHFRAAGAVA
jgi:hypothetical protein